MNPSMTSPVSPVSEARAARTASKPKLAGKHVGMVTYSPYPFDPRPRRAVDALVGEGATVDLICLGGDSAPKRMVLDGINVLRIPLKHERGGKFRYVFGYAAFIFISATIFALRSITRRYDLIYVHNMPDILVLSALIPKALGAKVILDLHDPMPELMMAIFHAQQNSTSVKWLKRIEKWSIARADLAITVSDTFKRIFSDRSCPPDKIAVVMNSPDNKIFPFRAARLAASRERADDGPFVILYHGSIVERNGLEVAIHAMEQVRETIPAIEFRIVGSATPFLERMMGVAQAKHLGDIVRYRGPRGLEDLVAEIDDCDLGVIPNHRNAFTEVNTPTRMFEYLVRGKPVIAPSTSGIREYFGQDSLLFFEPGNAADLARQIEYVLSHPPEVRQIVENGQRVYLDHTWERERETLVSQVAAVLCASR
jgi:glycosyltransferase involved in cell wall biosynthesis